jgi:hypothetical protein
MTTLSIVFRDAVVLAAVIIILIYILGSIFIWAPNYDPINLPYSERYQLVYNQIIDCDSLEDFLYAKTYFNDLMEKEINENGTEHYQEIEELRNMLAIKKETLLLKLQ